VNGVAPLVREEPASVQGH